MKDCFGYMVATDQNYWVLWNYNYFKNGLFVSVRIKATYGLCGITTSPSSSGHTTPLGYTKKRACS